jgi:N utilization substance protein B
VQFLYQCESENIFYFSLPHFESFLQNFKPQGEVRARELCKGIFDRIEEIDRTLSEVSQKWAVGRMAATDRLVLRLAVFELLEGETPVKVVLNEAIELAKKYGSGQSGRFVNGVLDSLLERIPGGKDLAHP